MAFIPDEHSRQHVERIERANKLVVAQFCEIFQQRAPSCKDTKGAIEGSFLIPTITQIFYFYSVATQAPLQLPDELIELGLDNKEKSSVKARLIKAYAASTDFGGKRFPEVFILRFCAKRSSCAENSIRPVLTALYRIALLEQKISEYTGVMDCIFTDELLKSVNYYYQMQRFNPASIARC